MERLRGYLEEREESAVVLVVILFSALGLRLALLTGFYGSDDVVFVGNAYRISNGELTPEGYIGSLRYGFNLPLAASIHLFGVNEYAACLYPLLASLANIVLIWRLGLLLFGRGTALVASILMAFCPLDMIWAGRIQADAPLIMLMTASVLFLSKGCEAGRGVSYVRGMFALSGIMLGLAYTTKNVGLFLWPFLGFAAFYRRSRVRDFAFVALGFIMVFLLESTLFLWYTGDPLYTFSVQAEHNKKVVSGILGGTLAGGLPTSVLSYPYWAFVMLQHSGLMFYVTVLLGCVYLIRGDRASDGRRRNVVLVFAWFASIAFILTFFVMSWDPFVLIWKQSNYMLMFIPPLTLITGYFAQSVTSGVRAIVLGIYVLTSVVFSQIEHEVLAAESHNARAAARFYLDHGDGWPLYTGLREKGVIDMFMRYKNTDKVVPYDDPYGNVSSVGDLTTVQHGLVSVNSHWLKRWERTIPLENRRLIEAPPEHWRVVAVLQHESRGILYWSGELLLALGESGWIPDTAVRYVEGKVRQAIAPRAVRIYEVAGSGQSGG